jgi:hypothetical protein
MGIEKFVDREVERQLKELKVSFDPKKAYILWNYIGTRRNYQDYQGYVDELSAMASQFIHRKEERRLLREQTRIR